MIALINGVYEGTVSQINDGKTQTSIILNQLGQEEKCKIKVPDGFVLPTVGESLDVAVTIKKGSYNGKPFVSVKAL